MAASLSSSGWPPQPPQHQHQHHHHQQGKKKKRTEEPRKVRAIASRADHAELERHYKFVLPPPPPPPDGDDDDDADDQQQNVEGEATTTTATTAKAAKAATTTSSSCWQDRMVEHYHRHLYKEYALADLSRALSEGQLGLRWRTHREVLEGKGSMSCGNKHCPSHDMPPISSSDGDGGPTSDDLLVEAYLQAQSNNPPSTERDQIERLKKIPFGALPNEWEVPFTYVEDGSSKTELVKLRLCARCAPLLFAAKGHNDDESPHLAAWRSVNTPDGTEEGGGNCGSKRDKRRKRDDGGTEDDNSDGGGSESSDGHHKKKKKKSRRRRKKRKRR